MSLADEVAALVLQALQAEDPRSAIDALAGLPRVADAIRRAKLLAAVEDFRRRRGISVLDACERVARREGCSAHTVRAWWVARDVEERDGKAHQLQPQGGFQQAVPPIPSPSRSETLTRGDRR